MTAPSLRAAMTGTGTLLFTSLILAAGVMAMAWPWVSLGWISLDQFVGMLIGGVVVAAQGVVAVACRLAWFYLTWPHRRRRMRDYALFVARTSHKPSSLGGAPRSAAEGWTSPVDAAELANPALPDSSAVVDIASHRRRS